MNTDKMLRAYIECALWSSHDSDDTPMDVYHTSGDISPEAFARMRADVDAFAERVRAVGTLGYLVREAWTDEQLGHDFWLTRNGHGAGFWDRGLSGGAVLTEIARAFGTADLYIGDDGEIHHG